MKTSLTLAALLLVANSVAVLTSASSTVAAPAGVLGRDFVLMEKGDIDSYDPRGGAPTRIVLGDGTHSIEIGYAEPIDANGWLDDTRRYIVLAIINPDGTATRISPIPSVDAAGDPRVFVFDRGATARTFVLRGTTRHVLDHCPTDIMTGEDCIDYVASRWTIIWQPDGTFAISTPIESHQVIGYPRMHLL